MAIPTGNTDASATTAGRNVLVAVPRPVPLLFTYRLPDASADPLAGSLKPGCRVAVEFGRSIVVGFVAGFPAPGTGFDGVIKPVLKILDAEPAIPQDLFELALWTAGYYFCAAGEALALALPQSTKGIKPVRTVRLLRDAGAEQELSESERKIVAVLAGMKGSATLEKLAKKSALSRPALRNSLAGLEKRKIAECGIEIEKRDHEPTNTASATSATLPSEPPAALTSHQASAVSEVSRAIDAGTHSTFLLHGVTGSGKTEVYIRLCAHAVAAGKRAIVLVPEISLTFQMIDRFRNRLGNIAVVHSGLKTTERRAEMEKIRLNTADVIIGARSAIFSPVRNVGLIVVDEEHDTSYKQAETPRYHARDVAVKRGSILGAAVLLGSATPSLETFYNASAGKYRLLSLPERVMSRPMPEIAWVDYKLRKSRPAEGRLISPALDEAIRATIAKKEQAILFLNRRGTASLLVCPACGKVWQCKNCSISLTWHKDERFLKCHYCDYTERPPDVCPDCDGADFAFQRLGTKTLEEETARSYPEARVARLDRDTARRAGKLEETLAGFAAGKIDILIGTQMITKGHDFPSVTLVGVVSADESLTYPDFRAGERTFQLITQVAGRAGRGENPGSVVIQTYYRTHHSLQCGYDYAKFYEHELRFRRLAKYPPFERITVLYYHTATQEAGRAATMLAAGTMGRLARAWKDIAVLGPAAGLVPKIKNRYHWKIIFKGKSPGRIHDAVGSFLERMSKTAIWRGRVKYFVDTDPAQAL